MQDDMVHVGAYCSVGTVLDLFTGSAAFCETHSKPLAMFPNAILGKINRVNSLWLVLRAIGWGFRVLLCHASIEVI